MWAGAITRTTFPTCRAHYPGGSSGCVCRLLPRITQPSPNGRRVGIRIVTFKACSGFTHVTACGRRAPSRFLDETITHGGQAYSVTRQYLIPGRGYRLCPLYAA